SSMLDMPPACLRSPPWGDDEASTELRINCGEHRCKAWLLVSVVVDL
ncbi:MAG: hypothetical protein ACI9MR_002460, partial [Myxococcota bacterium]